MVHLPSHRVRPRVPGAPQVAAPAADLLGDLVAAAGDVPAPLPRGSGLGAGAAPDEALDRAAEEAVVGAAAVRATARAAPRHGNLTQRGGGELATGNVLT